MEGSGNTVINAMYEAKLEEGKVEQERRKTGFIRHKNQVLKFFSKKSYQEYQSSKEKQPAEVPATVEVAKEKGHVMEDESLQKEDVFLESMAKTLTNLEASQHVAEQENSRESDDSKNLENSGLGGEELRAPRRSRSARGLVLGDGEVNGKADQRPESLRRRRSARDLEFLKGNGTDNDDKRPRANRRRSARDLDFLKGNNTDNEDKRPKPIRRRSARDLDLLEGGPLFSEGTQKPMRKPRSAGNLNMLKHDPRTSRSTHELKSKSSRSPMPQRKSGRSDDRRKGSNSRTSKSDHNRNSVKREIFGKSDARLECSLTAKDFRDSRNGGSHDGARKNRGSRERSNQHRGEEISSKVVPTEPTNVKDVSGKPRRKPSRNRKEHRRGHSDLLQNDALGDEDLQSSFSVFEMHETPPLEGPKSNKKLNEGNMKLKNLSASCSNLMTEKRDKRSLPRKPRHGVASRTKSSPDDLRRMKKSISNEDGQHDEENESENPGKPHKKRPTRSRSSPKYSARLAASTSSIGGAISDEFGQKSRKPSRSRQGARGKRLGQQSKNINIYKTRREKLSSSLNNICFDYFSNDGDDGDNTESEASNVVEDETHAANPVGEAPDDALGEEEKWTKEKLKKIKKNLAAMPTRFTEIIKTPPVPWLAILCLLLLVQPPGVAGSMLGLLRDDDLEKIERSKLVKAYKTATHPTNDYLVHHDCAFGNDNDDSGENSCQAEQAHRRSVFHSTSTSEEQPQPLVCLAFLSCCGRTDLLQSTLNAVIRHMEEDEPQVLRDHYEIAWVDNGSPVERQQHIANTFEIDHALPMPRNMGLAWGMNALMFDMCTAPYILLLEEDWLYMDAAVAEPTKPRKHAIAQAIALLQSDPVDPETRRPLKGVFLRTESNIVPTSKGVVPTAALTAPNAPNAAPYTVDNLEYRISCMKFQQTNHIFGAFTNGSGLYERKALTDQVGRMYGEPGDVFSDLSVEGNYCFRVGLQFCAARIPMDPQLPVCDYDDPSNQNIPATCAAAFAHIGGGRGTRPARRKHMKCVDDAWNFYGTPYFDQYPKEPCSAKLGTIWEQLNLNAHFQEVNDEHNEAVFVKEQEQRKIMIQMADLFEDKAQRPDEFRKYYGGHDPQYAAMSDDEIRNFPDKLRKMAKSPHQLPGFWDILGRPVGVDFDVP